MVTGAAGAIGRAIVSALSSRGYSVLGVGRHAPADPAMREIDFIESDLSTPAGLSHLVTALKGERLDAVVAAHGVDGSGPLAELTSARVDQILRVNAASVVRLYESLRPSLTHKASYVVVASQAGLVAEPANVAYCAAKFAVVGWVTAMAAMSGPGGVTFHALCAGCTESPLLFAANARMADAQNIDRDDFLAGRRDRIPLRRFAAPAETAEAAAYLCQPGVPRPVVLTVSGGEVLH
ncbi:hypothetical protein GCM10010199_46440 [Dactylosporangium roseum]